MAKVVKYTKVSDAESGLVSEETNNDLSDTNGFSDGSDRVQLVMEENEKTGSEQKPFRLKTFVRSCKSKSRCRRNSWKAVAVGVLAFAVALMISFVITLILSEPVRRTFYNGGVATDVPVCSERAGEILKQGGSAVDAAISAMLCVGVVNPESSGIGGGGFMVVYDPSNQSSMAIDFREVAPSAATEDMFHGSANLSRTGGLSVAVPGELAGMKRAHRLFGRLSWEQLFQPAIELAENGFEMTPHLSKSIKAVKENVNKSSLFYKWYFDENGSMKKAGSIIRRPEYAEVLKKIAKNDIGEFYNGSISKEIVDTIKGCGGIIELEDLRNYKPLDLEPASINISEWMLVTPPLPSGGPELLFILNVMKNLVKDGILQNSGPTYHHLIETFKYAFSIRSDVGDPWCESCDREAMLKLQNHMLDDHYASRINNSISSSRTFNVSHYNSSYIAPDRGTTHISVVAPDGMAISVTTSVNGYFGSKLITPTSGIVLNNDMDDFSSPNVTNEFGLEPSEANFIQPGKRGASSTCPTIVLKRDEKGNLFPKLVSGGAGGTHILTANAQAMLRVLFFGEDISDAIEAKRLHHQLIPNVVKYEEDYPESILDYLMSLGHKIEQDTSFAEIEQVSVDDSSRNVTAHSDSRKGGIVKVVNVN